MDVSSENNLWYSQTPTRADSAAEVQRKDSEKKDSELRKKIQSRTSSLCTRWY